MQEIEAFPGEDPLWKTMPGITNSAGNLALHLEGNLREFVGRQLGQRMYSRKRDLEFSSAGVSRAELGSRLADLKQVIPEVIAGLSSQQLSVDYPEIVLGVVTSTQQFLIALYAHLNWHRLPTAGSNGRRSHQAGGTLSYSRLNFSHRNGHGAANRILH